MKILIFGASGMIGHKMYLHLQECGHDVYGTLHHDLKNYQACSFFKTHTMFPHVDVTDRQKVTDVLEGLKPDVIINCVGITLRKPEIKNLEYCTNVNSEFPHFLKNWAIQNDSYMVHFSTDCVFNGSKEFILKNQSLTLTIFMDVQ